MFGLTKREQQQAAWEREAKIVVPALLELAKSVLKDDSVKDLEQARTARDLLGTWVETLTKERDELREQVKELQENGDRLLAIAESAVVHQRDMVEAAKAPLLDQIQELTADAERLNWLERNPRLAELTTNGVTVDCYYYAVAGAPGLKLREIIDTARTKPEQGA